jgi:hypothetical protein
MTKFRNLIGERFGRLSVVSYQGSNNSRNSLWTARCDCGNLTSVVGTALTRGKTQSCGCLRAESMRQTARKNRRHGEGGNKSPEYSAWSNMKDRCLNQKHHAYQEYGGRGITVCTRWLVYENFIADVGRRPSPGHSLDRYPNNNGNYEPGNCRWANRSQQQQNKRGNVLLTLGERTLTVAEWSRSLRIPDSTIRNRMRRGLTVAAILDQTTARYRA